MMAQDYLEKRAHRGDKKKFSRALAKIPTKAARQRNAFIKACKEVSTDPTVEKTVQEWQGFDEKINGSSP